MELTLGNVETLTTNDFLDAELNCQCGRTHSVDISETAIGNGAINKLPEIVNKTLKKRPGSKALIVADINTFEVAGKKAEELLKAAGIPFKTYVYKTETALVPNEEAIGKLTLQIDKSIDLFITVGSGSLNDIVKAVSFRSNIPSIIIATAPSMDGYASNTSALIVENLKKSVECALPKVIIGDTDILKNAPMKMILAGLGDMIGKYSALCDWRLSRLINDEYYCEVTAKISADATQKCVDNIDGVKEREDGAIENILDGLIRIGIAQSFMKNSRPASGSEHHLSHFWEMKFILDGKEALLHGTKVGLTSSIAAKLYELLLKKGEIDFKKAEEDAKKFDESEWRRETERLYEKASPEVLELSKTDGRNSIEDRIKRINIIKNKFPEIKKIAESMLKPSEIEGIMKKAGAPTDPAEVGIDRQLAYDAIMVAKDMRPRYTILNLLGDLGLLKEFADNIIN
jgi:glycerol-1-phosphate dehydrogenase [NAD(P)+]